MITVLCARNLIKRGKSIPKSKRKVQHIEKYCKGSSKEVLLFVCVWISVLEKQNFVLRPEPIH